MEMSGGLVTHEGLDVEINRNVPGREERDGDAGAHFLGMYDVALSLHTSY